VAAAGWAGCSDEEAERAAAPAKSAVGEATEGAKEAGQEAREAGFLTALAAIDRSLAEQKDEAVRAGRDICQDVKDGKDEETVVKNAAAHFEVDSSKAQQIVTVTKTALCD
jgi:DNA-binding ferritin-like protein